MALTRRDVLSLSVIAVSGCTALGKLDDSNAQIQGPTRWETYGRGPTHQASYERGAIPSNAPSTDRTFELSGSLATSPVASEDHLVVGDERGVLVVQRNDGGFQRRLEPPGTVAGTPCLDDGRIYLTSYGRSGRTDSAHVLAMTPEEDTTWRTELSADVVTSPTVRDGTVFVRSGAGYLALSAESGELRWRQDAESLGEVGYLAFENFGPAAGSDVVVFPDRAGITAIDPTDGTIRWRKGLQKARSCPVIADGTVYVTDVRSGVHAFDVATGDRAWRWHGTGCWAPPAVQDDTIYTTEDHDVVALDRERGTLEWRTQAHGLHGAVQSGLSVVGDAVLASSSSSGVVAVEAGSGGAFENPGTKRWTVSGTGFNTPIAAGDRIAFVDYGTDGPSLRVMK